MRFRGDVQAINARRTWVIEQLAALIRNGAIPKDDTCIRAILDWFTVHGLFIVRKPSLTSEFLAVRFHSVSNTFISEPHSCHQLHSVPSPTFSDDLRRLCKERLLSCLGELTNHTTVVKNGTSSYLASARLNRNIILMTLYV